MASPLLGSPYRLTSRHGAIQTAKVHDSILHSNHFSIKTLLVIVLALSISTFPQKNASIFRLLFTPILNRNTTSG